MKDTSLPSCTPNPNPIKDPATHKENDVDCLRKCTNQYTSPTQSGDYPYKNTMLTSHCQKYCQNNWDCLITDSTNGTNQTLIDFCQSEKAITQNPQTNKWKINTKYKPICSCFYPKNYYVDLKNQLEKNLKLNTTHRNIGNPSCWLPDCFNRKYFQGEVFTDQNTYSVNGPDNTKYIYPTSNKPPTCNIQQFQICANKHKLTLINSQGDVTIDQKNRCFMNLKGDDSDDSDNSLYNTIGIIIVSVIFGIPLLYFIIISIISLVKKK
jgi:hypothetical protein